MNSHNEFFESARYKFDFFKCLPQNQEYIEINKKINWNPGSSASEGFENKSKSYVIEEFGSGIHVITHGLTEDLYWNNA